MTDSANFTTKPDAIKTIIDHARRGKDVSPHILLGPVVRERDPHTEAQWYFVVASGDKTGARFDQIGSPDEELAGETRGGVLFGLMQERTIVIHDCDDELNMVKWCDAIWPSEKTRRIRADIEAERAQDAMR